MKKSLLVLFAAFLSAQGADLVGQGFLKTQGGEVRTCAGNAVYLEKYNKNEEESFIFNLGKLHNLKKLSIALQSLVSIAPNKPTDPRLAKSYGLSEGATNYDLAKEILKKILEQEEKIEKFNKSKVLVNETICDAQGNFEFFEVASGVYYTGTTVEWLVGKEKQGGVVYSKAEIANKKKKVFITEQIIERIE